MRLRGHIAGTGLGFVIGSGFSREWPLGCILWPLPLGGSLMVIPDGTRLGHYEVLAALGAGLMDSGNGGIICNQTT
jgi:hypothetical protein